MLNQENSKLTSITVNGQQIAYDIHGEADGPVILLVSGWCQDHRLFDNVVKPLSEHHKVLRINWRGHTDPTIPVEDFGVSEQADDVIAVLNALDIQQVIPVSTSHGGWANIEICQRLGIERVPRTVVIDWILIEAGEDFLNDLQESQNPDHWVAGRQRLFDHWQGVSTNQAISNHLTDEMASFGYDMWARSCRVIENAYRTWGSPLKRMAALDPKRSIVHIYSQAPVPGYEEMQQKFIAEHPWFGFDHISGETHFPTIESPDKVAQCIINFVSAHSVH